MTEQWVIEYDYRSDNGPRMVGPFPSRQAAEAWADTLRGPGWEAEFSYCPVTPPELAGRSEATT